MFCCLESIIRTHGRNTQHLKTQECRQLTSTFRFNSTSAFLALLMNTEYGIPCCRTPALIRSIHSLRKSLFLFCKARSRKGTGRAGGGIRQASFRGELFYDNLCHGRSDLWSMCTSISTSTKDRMANKRHAPSTWLLATRKRPANYRAQLTIHVASHLSVSVGLLEGLLDLLDSDLENALAPPTVPFLGGKFDRYKRRRPPQFICVQLDRV